MTPVDNEKSSRPFDRTRHDHASETAEDYVEAIANPGYLGKSCGIDTGGLLEPVNQGDPEATAALAVRFKEEGVK